MLCVFDRHVVEVACAQGLASAIVNSNNFFLFVDERILTLINGTLIG
jgi:hypothetical protein